MGLGLFLTGFGAVLDIGWSNECQVLYRKRIREFTLVAAEE